MYKYVVCENFVNFVFFLTVSLKNDHGNLKRYLS